MKSLSQSLLVLLSSLSVTTACQVLGSGECPIPPVQRNFDITRYLGRWWEYQRYPTVFEIAGTCGTANYTLLASDKIKIVNSGIRDRNFLFYRLRERSGVIGEAVVVDPAEPAKLLVTFPGPPVIETNYFVMETDYENYAVVFNCSGNSTTIQVVWILTRVQGMKPPNLDQIYRNLQNAGIDTEPLITVKQNDCTLMSSH